MRLPRVEDWKLGDAVVWTTHVGGYTFPMAFLACVMGITGKRVRIAIPRSFAGPKEKIVLPGSLRAQSREENQKFLWAWVRSLRHGQAANPDATLDVR